jgi:hypothetical protein
MPSVRETREYFIGVSLVMAHPLPERPVSGAITTTSPNSASTPIREFIPFALYPSSLDTRIKGFLSLFVIIYKFLKKHLHFEVYLKDTYKRARNMKFTSMFFTASAVYLRGLTQKYQQRRNHSKRCICSP